LGDEKEKKKEKWTLAQKMSFVVRGQSGASLKPPGHHGDFITTLFEI